MLGWGVRLTVGLATAAFALAPSAAGAPPEDCKPLAADLPFADVAVGRDCSVHVVLFGDLACFWGTEAHTVSAADVHVTYYECAPPEGSAPTAASCPEKTVPLFLEGSYLAVHRNCTADLFLFPEITCVGPWTGHLDRTVGPLHVSLTYCRPPGPPPQ